MEKSDWGENNPSQQGMVDIYILRTNKNVALAAASNRQ
jgi:hypothetical protein